MAKVKPGINIDTIKRKIKTLQNQARRERSKVLLSQKSGSAADEVYFPQFWCYEKLLFLIDPKFESDSSITNFDYSTEPSTFAEEEVQVQVDSQTAKKPKLNKEELQEAALDAYNLAKNSQNKAKPSYFQIVVNQAEGLPEDIQNTIANNTLQAIFKAKETLHKKKYKEVGTNVTEVDLGRKVQVDASTNVTENDFETILELSMEGIEF